MGLANQSYSCDGLGKRLGAYYYYVHAVVDLESMTLYDHELYILNPFCSHTLAPINGYKGRL